MFLTPGYQLFRRISPAQAEGRLDESLCVGTGRVQKEADKKKPAESNRLYIGNGPFSHAGSIRRFRPVHKGRSGKVRGFMLVELTMSLSLLTVVGLILLKLSLNIIHPRQHTLQQVLSDSYLTFERSMAERMPMEDLVSNTSLWPMYPKLDTKQVYIGKLPGGKAVYGDVTRTRMPDVNNYPIDGGTGTTVTNPAAMKIWRMQSILRYKIAGRMYVKSRTVVRSQ